MNRTKMVGQGYAKVCQNSYYLKRIMDIQKACIPGRALAS